MSYDPYQGQPPYSGQPPHPQQPPQRQGPPQPPPTQQFPHHQGPPQPHQQPPYQEQSPYQQGSPQPPHQPPPHQQQPLYQEEPPPSQQPSRWRSHENADTIARIVQTVTGIATAVFFLHILFVVFGANEGNGFVAFVYGLAKVLVLGLGDVFTPGDATFGVIMNYAFAAFVYIIVGRLIIRAVRRP